MWEANTYVTSALTVVGFFSAAIINFLRDNIREKEQFIRNAAEGHRGPLVKDALKFLRVDTDALSPERQFDVAMARFAAREALLSKAQMFALWFGSVATIASSLSPAKAKVAGANQAGHVEMVNNVPEWHLPSDYTVWFGTNRRPVNDQDESAGFSRSQDNRVHYGTCNVFIPKAHQFGSVGSGWRHRLLTLTDDRLKLQIISPLSEHSFWESVRFELERWRNPNEKQALVYLHGYNVGFEDAAIRAAQIGFDLKALGVTAFFSWPSKGDETKYPEDETSIVDSEPQIQEFLIHFAKAVGANRVHIIAHSMGNRGLLHSMSRIAANAELKSGIQFGQIILAAPDVSVTDFTNWAATAYKPLSERTTIYVSPSDRANRLSKWFHGGSRVGFTPPVTVVQGLDTVEVPNFNLDELGHSYYAEAAQVLHDMYTLLRDNRAPDSRQGLLGTNLVTGKPYWTFVSPRQ